jgi:hypothetical protein
MDKPCLDCDATVTFSGPGDATGPNCVLPMFFPSRGWWVAIRDLVGNQAKSRSGNDLGVEVIHAAAPVRGAVGSVGTSGVVPGHLTQKSARHIRGTGKIGAGQVGILDVGI